MGSDCRVPRIAGGVGVVHFRFQFDAQLLSEVRVNCSTS